MTLRKISAEMNEVDLSSLGIASRLVDNVASQADIRVTGGVERVTLEGDRDALTGAYVPKDSRITLAGSWVVYETSAANVSVPTHNPVVPLFATNGRIESSVADSTITVTWRGTSLVVLEKRSIGSGIYSVVTDGGASVQHDTYSAVSTTVSDAPRVIASGLAYGDHTTVITVTGTKHASSSDAKVLFSGFDILTSTDATVKYTTGTAFPQGEKTTVATAGSLSLTAISTATGRKDLVIMRAGETAPEVVTGTASAAADNLATFQSKNEIAFKVLASDTTGKLANVWATTATSYGQGAQVNIGAGVTEYDATSTDYIVIGFIGTGIKLVTKGGPDQGNFAWSIDGGSETTVSNYAALAAAKEYNLSYNLAYGYHQLKIRKVGTKEASSSNNYVTIYGFDIYHPKAPACPADAMPLAEVIPTPTNGWVRYDDAAGWVYTGANWTVGDDSFATGGSKHINTNTNTTDSAKYVFTGTQYRVYMTVGSIRGIAALYLDGVFVQNIDCYSASAAAAPLLYTSPVLAAGTHTVEIRATNTRNASNTTGYSVALDSIEVLPLPAQVRDVRNFSVIGDDKLEKLEEKLADLASAPTVVSGGTKIQSGIHTKAGSTTETVTFPTAFASAPTVVITPIYASAAWAVLTAAPTTTGFSYKVVIGTGGSAGADVGAGNKVHWMAIGD